MSEDRVARAVVGIAFILGSLVLLFFSAFPELRCVRSDAGKVECRSEAYLFNYLKVRDRAVSNVGVVTLLPPGADGGRPHLRFSSPAGLVDLGYFAQRFVDDAEILKEFLSDRGRRSITLSKTLGGRSLFAHVIASFMFLLGVVTLLSLRGSPEVEPDWERYGRELDRQ